MHSCQGACPAHFLDPACFLPRVAIKVDLASTLTPASTERPFLLPPKQRASYPASGSLHRSHDQVGEWSDRRTFPRSSGTGLLPNTQTIASSSSRPTNPNRFVYKLLSIPIPCFSLQCRTFKIIATRQRQTKSPRAHRIPLSVLCLRHSATTTSADLHSYAFAVRWSGPHSAQVYPQRCFWSLDFTWHSSIPRRYCLSLVPPPSGPRA